jgi:5,10-methylenetetrahydromethanopterin reductase
VTVRTGICLVGDPLDTWRSLLPRLAGGGFAMVGVPDSQSIYPDVYIRSALLADQPAGYSLGPFVVNPLTRDPAVAAGEVAALARIAPGRVFLGIGRGDSALATIGRAPATPEQVEDYARTVRRLLPAEVGRVPLYLAAVGERALRLAGRLGDGVIIGAGIDRSTVDRSLSHVEAGARSVGRSLADLDVWWYALGGLADDETEADHEIRHSLTSFSNAAFKSGLAGKGVPAEFVSGVRAIVGSYDPMAHASFGNRHHADLVAAPAFRAYLSSRFAVSGTPATVVEQITRAERAGVTNLWLSVRAPDKNRFLRLWTDAVAPALTRDR